MPWSAKLRRLRILFRAAEFSGTCGGTEDSEASPLPEPLQSPLPRPSRRPLPRPLPFPFLPLPFAFLRSTASRDCRWNFLILMENSCNMSFWNTDPVLASFFHFCHLTASSNCRFFFKDSLISLKSVASSRSMLPMMASASWSNSASSSFRLFVSGTHRRTSAAYSRPATEYAKSSNNFLRVIEPVPLMSKQVVARNWRSRKTNLLEKCKRRTRRGSCHSLGAPAIPRPCKKVGWIKAVWTSSFFVTKCQESSPPGSRMWWPSSPIAVSGHAKTAQRRLHMQM